jgi:hypothetical protein
MIRQLMGATAVLALSLGIAWADEIRGRIVKIEGNKITVVAVTKGEKEAREITVAKDVKIRVESKDGTKEILEGGLEASVFKAKGGVMAIIRTDDDRIAQEIIVKPPPKRK